jgi:hypothetical protein
MVKQIGGKILPTLLASGAYTVSGVSDSYHLPMKVKAVTFLLNLTSAAKDAGDLLDVYIQESPDNGTTWNDRIHFSQITGVTAAVKYKALINCESEPEVEVAAISDGVLAAGTVNQGPLCSPLRVKYVITPDADPISDQSFTFSVVAQVVV